MMKLRSFNLKMTWRRSNEVIRMSKSGTATTRRKSEKPRLRKPLERRV